MQEKKPILKFQITTTKEGTTRRGTLKHDKTKNKRYFWLKFRLFYITQRKIISTQRKDYSRKHLEPVQPQYQVIMSQKTLSQFDLPEIASISGNI